MIVHEPKRQLDGWAVKGTLFDEGIDWQSAVYVDLDQAPSKAKAREFAEPRLEAWAVEKRAAVA